MAVELTTVGDDVAIVHDGVEVRRYDELEPDTTYVLDGVEVRTLERPAGELLCRFATVNDVHFGETDCGRLDESQPELGPILTVDAGQPPHPELMGRAAVPEIAAIEPSAVVVKGDLTAGARATSTPPSSPATARPSATGCTTSAATTTPWPARPTPTGRSASTCPA